MSAFRVVKSRNKIGLARWRWNLIADNGEPVATSEAYNSRQAALDGVDVVKRLASDAAVEEIDES